MNTKENSLVSEINFSCDRESFLQKSEWAQINKLFNNAKLIEVRDQTNTVTGAFFYKNTNALYKTVIKKLLGMPSGHLECHAGPILNENCTEAYLSDFLNQVLRIGRSNGVRDIFLTTNSFSNIKHVESLVRIAKEKGFSVEKNYNPIVDLRPPLDVIHMNCKNAARTGARKALKEGVEIKRCSTFEEYMLFVNLTSSVKEISTKKTSTYEKFWKMLSHSYSFFYSVRQNEVLSLLGTFESNGVATPISSCITPLGLRLRIPAQDLLFWEVIQYHKKEGSEFFELTPVSFDDENMSEKEKGIRSFKLKWSQNFLPQYFLAFHYD